MLIAEDDPNTAILVLKYLEHDGFQTTKAVDEKNALRLARKHQPEENKTLIRKDLRVAPEKHWVRRGDSPVYLTGSEFKLLCQQ